MRMFIRVFKEAPLAQQPALLCSWCQKHEGREREGRRENMCFISQYISEENMFLKVSSELSVFLKEG